MTTDVIQDLKARVRLSEFVARRVRLKRVGPDLFGLCPFPDHREKTGSFSVNDQKGFYHCFGCGAHGDAIDWLQKIEGLTLSEAIDRLRDAAGEQPRQVPDRYDAEARRKSVAAIWDGSRSIVGTSGEIYLRQARAITVDLPRSLRFHPELPPDQRSPETFPALVAAVTDLRGDVVAIQRTFLAKDGSSKAPIVNPKRSLGPLSLGSVRLDSPPPVGSTISIAEGIETGLSAIEIFKIPVWVALGSRLAGIDLPKAISNVVIFADRGKVGEVAAAKAAREFRSQRRRVSIRFPQIGKDFNDELRARRR
jgi:DNA primase